MSKISCMKRCIKIEKVSSYALTKIRTIPPTVSHSKPTETILPIITGNITGVQNFQMKSLKLKMCHDIFMEWMTEVVQCAYWFS